jgi:hypothetical protein
MLVADEPRTYLVECYWPGVDERKVASAVARAQSAALQLRREGNEIEFLGSILIHADETVFLLFRGAEEHVRAASVRSDILFERVLESLQIDGGSNSYMA